MYRFQALSLFGSLVLTPLVSLAQVAVPADASKDPRPLRPATVLLVTSQALAPAWQEFADWKTALGKSCRIVRVEDLQLAEGQDVPAAIRTEVLRSIREDGTRWVILGGDSEPSGGVVPHRLTKHSTPMPAQLPTDVYYVSEGGDWDADDDGVHGDWDTDRAACDYTNAKACIARIPMRTAADVAAYTAKVIRYESDYPSGKFASKMLYTCPEPHALPKVRRSWDDYIDTAWQDGEVVRWFAGDSPRAKDAPLLPDEWVAALNDGVASKIHMHGHGHLPAWVLEQGQQVKQGHVAKLVNHDALPIITTVSCNTGEFDSARDPSITESMLRAKDGGAIAIVTPSRPGIPVFADRADFRLMMSEGKLDGTTETMTKFWVYGLRDGLTTGEAFAAVKAEFADRAQAHPALHFIQCELNLLGDPTLDFRAAAPRTPKLTVPQSLPVGDQELVVTTDAPGAKLCLWKRGECYAVHDLDEKGNASVSVSCATQGKLQVTVAGAGVNVVSAEVEVR